MPVGLGLDQRRSVAPPGFLRRISRHPVHRVRVVAVHDEIDLPFGEVRTRLGGGLAGHNGLKSLDREFGGSDFWRVRVGVGRPDSTDPEIVSAWVLGRFREDPVEVADLVGRAADQTAELVGGIAGGEVDPGATGKQS